MGVRIPPGAQQSETAEAFQVIDHWESDRVSDYYATVAHLEEHPATNRKVGGSNPLGGTVNSLVQPDLKGENSSA